MVITGLLLVDLKFAGSCTDTSVGSGEYPYGYIR